MKIYLISQTERYGWDTYNSAVVAAESVQEARLMNPVAEHDESMLFGEFVKGSTWASKPEYVEVKFLGEAAFAIEKGIICASFNAG